MTASLDDATYRQARRRPTGRCRPSITRWRRFPVQPNDLALFDPTWEIHRRTKYGWRDSVNVAAAPGDGHEKLATEDLDHGRVIDSPRIESPFLVV